MSNEETNNIDLGAALSQAQFDPLWAARGHAINSYASIEQSLCFLLSIVGKMEPEVAHIIFFRINNSRARLEMIETLLARIYEGKYEKFWTSFKKLIAPLDQKRNNIVHWFVVSNIGDHASVQLTLRPAGFHYDFSNKKEINLQELHQFIRMCDFASRLCNCFCIYLSPPEPLTQSDMHDPWAEVFSRAIPSPLPSDFPIQPRT